MSFNTRTLSIKLLLALCFLSLVPVAAIGIAAGFSMDWQMSIPVKTLLAMGIGGMIALAVVIAAGAAAIHRYVAQPLDDHILTPLSQSMTLIRRISDGELSEPSALSIPVGDFARNDEIGRLMKALWTMQEQMRLVFHETDRLTAAVREGRSDVRGNVQPLSGKWREMLLGLNAILDTCLSPMTAMADAMQRISNGEIMARLDTADHDEFSTFRDTVNTMLENLRNIVQRFKSAADALAANSQELSVSSERMAQGAIQQAASVEEIAASTAEMAANMRQSASNAQQTETIAMQVAAEAQQSSQVVAAAVAAMLKIAKRVKVIDEISQQTQTLSLNASIEAARAHEYGRGFAVVSAEVRALAKRTRLAAEEITGLVRATLQASQEAEARLNALVPKMQHTAGLVREISAASQESSLGMTQMSSAIQQFDAGIQENVTTGEDISATAQALAMQANQLQELIAFFRLDNPARREQRRDPAILTPMPHIAPAPASLSADDSKSLTIGMSQEFAEYHPMVNAHLTVAHYITDMYARALITVTAQGEWIPLLVSDIPTLENGRASLYTERGVPKIQAHFELREGLTWGDGAPVTNQDVRFTWQVGINEHITIMRRKSWTQIERVEPDSQNDRKFTLYFAQANWKFNQLHDFYLLPQHLEGAVIRQWGTIQDAYRQHTHYATDIANPGLYLGPYCIAEVRPGSHLTLTVNPHFYGKPPYFRQIIIKFISDTRTLETNLVFGKIDMIASRQGLSLAQAVAFERRIQEKRFPYVVDFVPGIHYERIALQLRNPLLHDLRVRKALVYAINRDAMCQALFGGKQAKAIHIVPPPDSQYINDPKKFVLYEYAPDKAQTLLDDAGWTMRTDGYRYKDRQKLTFQLATTAGNKSRELTEEYLQQEWKKVGVETIIKNAPASEFLDAAMKSRFSAMAMFAWSGEPDMDLPQYLHSRNIPCEKNGFAGRNCSAWVNHKVDQWLDQFEREFDPEKRKALVANILYYYTDEVPEIPLYYSTINSVRPVNLAGYQVAPSFITETNRVEYWHLTT